MSILVSDFDRTFDRKERDIAINCEAIKRYIEAGNYFVLSSSRPFNSLRNKTIIHNIPYNYLGTCDGNFLFDNKSKRIFSCTIPHEIVERLRKLEKVDGVEALQYVYPGSYSNTYFEGEDLGSVAFVVNDNNITPHFLKAFIELQAEYPNYQYKRDGNRGIGYYKIRPKGLSKSTPIEFLSEQLQVPKSEIYTIGDDTNDFELIRDYNGFRVGHNRELKKVALGRYHAVHELVEDITDGTALKR